MLIVWEMVMQTTDQGRKPAGLKAKLMRWLRLTDETTIKVYHGYGHTESMSIYGHVLKFGPLPKKKFRRSFIRNTLALLRLFMVKPYPLLEVSMKWKDQLLTPKTDKDGFFRFEWKDQGTLVQGWQEVEVTAETPRWGKVSGKGHLYIPYTTQYGFISDIDDTFLISHSSNLRKRLFVLFTQNARSRQPFEGAVQHYQLLALSNTTAEAPNPFFYVSSSEWNLYDYILEFTRVQKIPEGIFLLNQLKQFSELLKTGQNHHQGKFTRITRILEQFPKPLYLRGDRKTFSQTDTCRLHT
jgi:phosphatidate phosphatase APP1